MKSTEVYLIRTKKSKKFAVDNDNIPIIFSDYDEANDLATMLSMDISNKEKWEVVETCIE